MQGYAGCRGGLHCCTSEKVASTGGCAKGSLRGLFCTARGGRLWKRLHERLTPTSAASKSSYAELSFLYKLLHARKMLPKMWGLFWNWGPHPRTMVSRLQNHQLDENLGTLPVSQPGVVLTFLLGATLTVSLEWKCSMNFHWLLLIDGFNLYISTVCACIYI